MLINFRIIKMHLIFAIFLIIAVLILPLNAIFTYNFHQPINLQRKLKPVVRSDRYDPIFAPEFKRFIRDQQPNQNEIEQYRKNDYFWDGSD